MSQSPPEQPALGIPPEDLSAQGEVMTRDLGTINEDGPNLTAMESPVARPNSDGVVEEMMHHRPRYSPVAQPGMDERIWWHTVRTPQPEHRQAGQPARGMRRRGVSRLLRRRGQGQPPMTVPPNQQQPSTVPPNG